MKYFAQKLILPGAGSGTPTPIEIHGPFPTKQGTQGVTEFETIADIVNKLLPIVFAVAGIILFFYLILAGFDLMLSGGDPKKAESAKAKITNAVIGFVIIFIAWWLTKILATIFGLEGF